MESVERTNMKVGDAFLLRDGTPGDIRTVAEFHVDPANGHRFGVSDTLGVFHYFGEIIPVED